MLYKSDNPRSSTKPVVLTIAGSDSGGGAGIQADLKTFMALDCHGLSAIAALTAQNTRGVQAIHRPPRGFLRAQLESLFSDFPVAAIKIGMLGSVATIETVAEALNEHTTAPVILDPVMVATSGDRLADRRAVAALRSLLLPLADVLTPNLPEASVLTGDPVADQAQQRTAAGVLLAQVRGGVLVKGGHLGGDTLVDLYVERPDIARQWRHPRRSIEGHGTGCTLAAAIAAYRARGEHRIDAVEQGIAFLQRALAAAYRPGSGSVHVPDQKAGSTAAARPVQRAT